MSGAREYKLLLLLPPLPLLHLLTTGGMKAVPADLLCAIDVQNAQDMDSGASSSTLLNVDPVIL
jgi:hypothetical protein